MIGAIIGDIVGSRFERSSNKSTEFELFTDECKFTDDTVLTIATAEAILDNSYDYKAKYQKYGKKYPNAGYGKSFKEWIKKPLSNDSWGNGSSMRISPIGWAFEGPRLIIESKKSSECSHGNKDAICCANLVTQCIYAALEGCTKEDILNICKTISPYDFDRKIDNIRKTYSFSSKAAISVPEAILCFYESTDFENAIRLAVSLGGDSDTQACIAGAIAQAYYTDISDDICEKAMEYLPSEFVSIIHDFNKTYNIN